VKVAFIGTGSMGGSMSRNLAAAGIDITVFDLNTESMQKPIAAGAKAALLALNVLLAPMYSSLCCQLRKQLKDAWSQVVSQLP
jgi:6-phosphogluconate dehydrogenase (decarboxylating)